MISVVIPSFEQFGYGVKHLTLLFDSLITQTNTIFEVVVSDNSKNEQIKNLCEQYGRKLHIRYVHNPEIGISCNLNSAIQNATHDKIKIMCMDDVCISNQALAYFSHALNKKNWAVSNSYFIDGKGSIISKQTPCWNPEILKGINSIGMPSVMAFRKNDFQFDINLKTLTDCEFYWLLHREYGAPEYIRMNLIGQRLHSNSTSSNQKHFGEDEYEYLKKKHNL